LEERRNTHPQGADHSRKRRKVRPGHVAGGVVMTVFTLVLIGVCTTLMLLGIFMKYVNTSLLPTLEVRAEDYTMSQSSVVYYQDKESGQWVEFQKVHGQENRVLIDIDDMSPYLWQAAVSIEDERFFSHHGVDWKRTLGATLLTLTGSNDSYGGSTITQQMLKNMTGENQNTINRKVKEIFGIMTAGILMYSTFLSPKEGITGYAFGPINIPAYNYKGSIFPVILSVWIFSIIFHLIDKHMPKNLRIVFSGALSFLISAPLFLGFAAPLGNWIAKGMTSGFAWLFTHAGPFAGALFCGIIPLTIIFGIKGWSAVELQNLEVLGHDYMLPNFFYSNLAGAYIYMFHHTHNALNCTIVIIFCEKASQI